MSTPASVSIIIPAYNEQATIEAVLIELLSFIESQPSTNFEIIAVDDASTDATVERIAKFPEVLLIRHPQNRGYGASLKSGIRRARGEFVLTMDADGQHIADEIGKLLPGAEVYDMVVGARHVSSSPAARRPGKRLINALAKYCLNDFIPDVNSGLRLIRRSVLMPYLALCSDRFSFSLSSTMALVSEGHFVRFVDIETRPRQGNQSQVRISSGLAALLMIVRSTLIFHPLRLFLPFGFFFGVIFAISFVMDLFQNNVSKATLALLLITANIFLAGFLADQIARARRALAQNDFQRSFQIPFAEK